LSFTVFTITSEMPVHMGLHLFVVMGHTDPTRSTSFRQLSIRKCTRSGVSCCQSPKDVHVDIGDCEFDVHVDNQVFVRVERSFGFGRASLGQCTSIDGLEELGDV